MPELPEVETIVRDLRPHLQGARLRNPQIFKTDVLRGVSSKRLIATIRNASVVGVDRRAKHIVITFEHGYRMVVQPRMTGNLMILERRVGPKDKQYLVFRAGIGPGKALVYRDVRRLGTISLLNERQWITYTGRIGPEPLADDYDSNQLFEAFQRTRQAVKKALMDQRLVAGVGNIYANEALFAAGIDPSRPANRLTRGETSRLCDAVQDILRAAIHARGTTLRDYRTGTGQRGNFQLTLHVYGRGGQACSRCRTRLTTTHAIDGRSTTFCWRCQGG